VLPPQPPALARAVGLDLVTRYHLRLTDPRDSRLGELRDGYELGAASWTGRQSTFVGFYTPPSDPAVAGPDLAARCAAAARWGAERLAVQGAERADILLVALGPVPGTLTAPPSNPAVHVGAVAVDPATADVAVLLPPPATVPPPRDVRERAQLLLRGVEPPTLAAVDLAERQAVAGGYAAPARQQLISRPVATYALIASFVLIFILEKVLIRDRYSDQGLYDMGALAFPPADWWRYVSSAFLHDPSSGLSGFGAFPAHLIFNSMAMYFVGRLVEQLYGRLVLVATFLVTAVGGGLVWVAYNQVTNAPLGLSIGASAGITGLLGLLVMLGRVQGKDVPVGIAHAMRQYAITYGAMVIVFGFLIANVNNIAHVGGIATGAAVGAVLPPLRRVGGRDLRQWEKVAIYLVCAASAAALIFAAANTVSVLNTSPGFNTGPVLPSTGP
jgi:membrane associated rhomboid family serine protease